ncbi:MAG: glycoside hydrolase family 38 C-terminal domain-containing protein, partial [Verrucomicrobiota bacterium]
PQICKGFELGSYYSYHGVPAHEYPVEFIWEGPDGSEILFVRPIFAGAAAFHAVELGSIVPDGETENPLVPGSARLDPAYRLADEELTDHSPFYTNDLHLEPDYDKAYGIYVKIKEAAAAESTTEHLLISEFYDSQNMSPHLADLVEEIAKRETNGDQIKLSTLSDYLDALRENVGELKRYKGEMVYPAKSGWAFRLFQTLASRMYLKQINREAEYLLTKWAEPFGTFAWLAGSRDFPVNEMDYAWKKMHINHSHDDIGGCSVDMVHEDMLWRYRQINETGRATLHRTLGSLAREIGTMEVKPGEYRVVIFNPLHFARSEQVELWLDMPEEFVSENLIAVAGDGTEVPCHVETISRDKNVTVEAPLSICPYVRVRRAKVLIEAKDVPALGYAEYKLAPASEALSSEATDLCCGGDWMENEHLKVSIENDGRLTLLDKSTGEEFSGLHYFSDDGQNRTPNAAWTHCPAIKDKLFTNCGREAAIDLVSQSDLAIRMKVKYNMQIPVGLDMDNQTQCCSQIYINYAADERSPKLIEIPIESILTLRKDSKRLDIETTLDNRAQDHRLRVMFPTGVETDQSCSDTAYDVVERTVGRLDEDDWVETQRAGGVQLTRPVLNFADVSSDARSLAVIVDGLPEYELLGDGERTMAVTLLRAFQNGRVDPDTPTPPERGSQAQGLHTFRYALYPHKGSWDQAQVMPEAYRHNLPMKVVQAM